MNEHARIEQCGSRLARQRSAECVCVHVHNSESLGSFSLSQDVSVSEIVFIHKSGGLTCVKHKPETMSNVGCGSTFLGLVTTKKGSNTVLMPLQRQDIEGFHRTENDKAHWYTLSGFGQATPEDAMKVWHQTGTPRRRI